MNNLCQTGEMLGESAVFVATSTWEPSSGCGAIISNAELAPMPADVAATPTSLKTRTLYCAGPGADA